MIKPSDPVHFLLVDDLAENLLSLEALLRREGLVLLKARSGPEALELLLTHEIALALLDVQMPGMDGFELAELMRGTERTRRVPIIFLTAGNADRQRRFRGYEAGAVDFLHKPIEPDILRSKSSVFFDLYRQQQIVICQRDELQRNAEALKEADRRKDEFLATLAHELRNPLAPIRNGLQLLRMGATEAVENEVRDIMDRQLTHMVRLIDDLLDVSRVSQGKIELRNERITLQSAIDAAVESSRPLIDAGQHELLLDMAKDEVWLDADLTRLAQVISNLLNNAAKYTPPHGRIILSAHVKDTELKIAVADNGVGIPAPMLTKVFDLFTQVDQTIDHAQGGLGIGLALGKRLVGMYGGSITADSPGINKGSIFTVCLPIAMVAAAGAPTPETMPANGQSSPLRVLVVDDNIPSAKTTGWMLELKGHVPNLVHDGIEALATARATRPDVILLDIGLPGMNGYDVCRALRKEVDFKDTIIIAQTGWGQDRDRQEARDAGFDHHLTKPVDFEEFSRMIASLQKPAAA